MSQFGSGGREDCWSEGATASLVEAWGDRYLQLNRGNLRQKDWSDVADAVNARQELLGRPRKTDVQCKNRIDTVKKKYKSEKSKSGPSQWPFFAKLDFLVGPPSFSSVVVKKPPAPRLPALPFRLKSQNLNPIPNLAVGSSSRVRMFRSPISSESSRGFEGEDGEEAVDDDDDEDDDDDVKENRRNERLNGGSGSAKRKWEGLTGCERGGGGGGALGELARAIENFAEVYERVESVKQQQMMELERQRMEFAKEIEFQRMKMFMEAQLEIEKMKRQKLSSLSVPPSSDIRAANESSDPATDQGIALNNSRVLVTKPRSIIVPGVPFRSSPSSNNVWINPKLQHLKKNLEPKDKSSYLPVKCSKCLKLGHFASSCFNNLICFRCGKYGHMARHCESKSPNTKPNITNSPSPIVYTVKLDPNVSHLRFNKTVILVNLKGIPLDTSFIRSVLISAWKFLKPFAAKLVKLDSNNFVFDALKEEYYETIINSGFFKGNGWSLLFKPWNLK